MQEIEFEIRTSKVKVDIKPLSVNQCWQGKRFKTPEYKSYEKNLILMLPKIKVPYGKLKIILEFGVSNMCADWDNPVKPFVDILQKKYWFNDYNIWEAEVRKIKVAKGLEYVTFEFISIDNNPINRLKKG